jgi:DNA-directed RNA polymerase specialized sigma24 family protein
VRDSDVTEGASVSVEDLYRRDGERLWRAVLLYSGDREVASDAVAEAFAQLLRRGDAVSAPDRWVWRAAFRIAAGDLKSRGDRRRAVVAPIPVGSGDDGRVADALLKLSSHQRSAIVLHYFSGYTYKEVATIIGSTPSAVSVHVTRGRRRLRTLLEDLDHG